jgi:hypothetical protein
VVETVHAQLVGVDDQEASKFLSAIVVFLLLGLSFI